jgi:hypothetical protein
MTLPQRAESLLILPLDYGQNFSIFTTRQRSQTSAKELSNELDDCTAESMISTGI